MTKDMTFFLVLFLGLMPLSLLVAGSSSIIHVDSVSGIMNESCWYGEQPCRTLDLALQGAMKFTNVSILLQPGGEYNITAVYRFVSKSGFELSVNQKANLQYATVFCKDSNAGLGFSNSSSISFMNVKIVGCGAVHNSTSRGHSCFLKFQVALYFLFCTEIVMENVSVSQSNGTGLVMYATVGQNKFTGCYFTENTPKNGSNFGGGGGVNVEFLYCVPGNTDCFRDGFNASSDYSSNASYLFDRCHFSNNNATTDNFIADSFVTPAGGSSVALGRGGGLSLLFKGLANNINVTIRDSHFLSNNADWGAGMEALFEDKSSNNSVQIFSSHFINNSCTYNVFSYQGTGGGGARIHFAGLYYSVKYNQVTMTDTVFRNNRAYFGGGVSFYTSRESLVKTPTNSIVFTNCEWVNNTARLGSAIDMSLWHEITDGVSVKPLLINCSFESNTVKYTEQVGSPAGFGAIYTDSIDITFEDKLNVVNNYGTGIANLDAGLEFSPKTNANFASNFGRNGGAIALFGYAFIKVHNSTVLKFVNNSAQLRGGAIYWKSIGNHDLFSFNCFIKYYNLSVRPAQWQSQFVFTDNKAEISGNSIYATTLLTCAWGSSPSKALVDQLDEVFCWNSNWDYTNDNCSNSIATDGASFTNASKGCKYHMSIIPGEYSTLPITVTDDRNNTLPQDSLTLSLDYLDKVLYQASKKVKIIPSVNRSELKMKVSTIQSRVLSTEVIVTIDSCPPGYSFNNSTMQCDFARYRYIQTNGRFSSKILRGSWIGYSNSTNVTLVTSQCLYCISSQNLSKNGVFINLPKDPEQIDSVLCQSVHRTGVLCGRCVSGFAPAVNSKLFQCVNCTSEVQYYSWLLYILTEFVPVTILLIIVVVFNISVTSGPGNAFIFFAQIVSSTFGINDDGTINYQSVTSAAKTLQHVYNTLYDIWNLNFFDFIPGFQYCLSPNLNSLEIRALQYITAVYPLLLLGIILLVIILYENHNRVVVRLLRPFHCLSTRFRCQWNIKRSIIDALGTFLVLSFTKFTIISAFIAYPASLYDENGTPIHQVCWIYGDYEYYSSEYAPFLVFSIVIFFLVCVMMPLVLLFYSLKPVYGCLNYLKLKFLLPGPRFQIFLNVFYNCYKDGTDGTLDLRFFASLYFGLRVIIIVMYSLAPSWEIQYIMQQIVCTIGILLFAAFRPYKYHGYNFLDAAAFSLLAVINIISFYNRYLAVVNVSPSPLTYWLQIILILLPLIYISVYLARYFYQANKTTLKRLFLSVSRSQKHSLSIRRLQNCFLNSNQRDTYDSLNHENSHESHKYTE